MTRCVDAFIPAEFEDTTFTSFGNIADADIARTNWPSSSTSASSKYLLRFDSITGQQLSAKLRTLMTSSALISLLWTKRGWKSIGLILSSTE